MTTKFSSFRRSTGIRLALGGLEREQHAACGSRARPRRSSDRARSCPNPRRGRSSWCARRRRRPGSRSGAILPSCRVSVRCDRSVSTTSASSVTAFGLLRSTARIGYAMSGAREPGHRHLIEQRLKQVVIRAIDQRDAHRLALELARHVQSAETAADDHDMRQIGRAREGFRGLRNPWFRACRLADVSRRARRRSR